MKVTFNLPTFDQFFSFLFGVFGFIFTVMFFLIIVGFVKTFGK
jgi:phage-related holin